VAVSDTVADPEGALPPAHVLELLRRDLIEGVYYPRERLVEAELAERYRARRAAVRTALIELANEGLVERERNRGARVRSVSVDEAIEIAEARLALQGLCAAHAAERGTPEDKRRLLGLLKALRTAVNGDDIDALVEANLAIAALIREMAGHETASRIIDQLLNRIHRGFPFVLPERRVESLHETERIVEAVLAGDVEEAEEATRDHRTRIVKALQDIRDKQSAQSDAAAT
jgi:DNA-binding GntR family transcriptional regulator